MTGYLSRILLHGSYALIDFPEEIVGNLAITLVYHRERRVGRFRLERLVTMALWETVAESLRSQ